MRIISCHKTSLTFKDSILIFFILQGVAHTLTRAAVYVKNKQLLGLCLKYGGDVNEVDSKQGTLLHALFERAHDINTCYEILLLLLDNGE